MKKMFVVGLLLSVFAVNADAGVLKACKFVYRKAVKPCAKAIYHGAKKAIN